MDRELSCGRRTAMCADRRTIGLCRSLPLVSDHLLEGTTSCMERAWNSVNSRLSRRSVSACVDADGGNELVAACPVATSIR